jgi:hypothetical protein
MSYWFKNGAVGVMVQVELYDSTKTATNGGLTGLTNSSTGLIIGTRCDNEAAFTTYTQAGGTIQTIATPGTYAAPSANNCRFVQIDSTNAPGLYEIQLLNARIAVSGAKYITITVPAVSGLNLMQMAPLVIPLTDMDPYSRPWQFQSQMTEGYSVNGTASTPEQAFFELKSLLQNKAISGTTLTSYQINGSTTAMTFTLNSASTPTSLLRAS